MLQEKSVPEMPIANASGMPSSINTVKAMRTISMLRAYSTSTAWLSSGSPRNARLTFSQVVISSRIAPIGKLMVTHE